jgi:transcription initiation factor IIF auxiliary subunit
MKIAQDYKYQGDDYWKWWVWIEGSDEELDRIDHVTYILHHTFPKPIRKVDDRASKFRLETAGWGVFTIHVKVLMKDGEEKHLTHDLELRYPSGKPTTA